MPPPDATNKKAKKAERVAKRKYQTKQQGAPRRDGAKTRCAGCWMTEAWCTITSFEAYRSPQLSRNLP